MGARFVERMPIKQKKYAKESYGRPFNEAKVSCAPLLCYLSTVFVVKTRLRGDMDYELCIHLMTAKMF